jgi:hypothetical protein
MLYQYVLAYGQYLLVLISLIGAGVLFFKTKTMHTAMFFFGFLLFTAITPIWLLLSTIIGQPLPFGGLVMIFVGIASFTSSLGLLLYALSLPKRSKP